MKPGTCRLENMLTRLEPMPGLEPERLIDILNGDVDKDMVVGPLACCGYPSFSLPVFPFAHTAHRTSGTRN